MSHETHAPQQDTGSKTPFQSSFWFVIILVFLFIAAVNFVNVMGHSEEGHGGGGHQTEAPQGGGHDAPATQEEGHH